MSFQGILARMTLVSCTMFFSAGTRQNRNNACGLDLVFKHGNMKIIQAWAHPLAFHHHCYFTNSIDLVIVTGLGSFPGVVGRVFFQRSIYFSLSPSRRSPGLAHLQVRKGKEGKINTMLIN